MLSFQEAVSVNLSFFSTSLLKDKLWECYRRMKEGRREANQRQPSKELLKAKTETQYRWDSVQRLVADSESVTELSLLLRCLRIYWTMTAWSISIQRHE